MTTMIEVQFTPDPGFAADARPTTAAPCALLPAMLPGAVTFACAAAAGHGGRR